MKKLARILWILFLLPLTIQAQEEGKNTLVQKERKFKLFNKLIRLTSLRTNTIWFSDWNKALGKNISSSALIQAPSSTSNSLQIWIRKSVFTSGGAGYS